MHVEVRNARAHGIDEGLGLRAGTQVITPRKAFGDQGCRGVGTEASISSEASRSIVQTRPSVAIRSDGSSAAMLSPSFIRRRNAATMPACTAARSGYVAHVLFGDLAVESLEELGPQALPPD